ncbi:hypothetical protein EV138_1132 [Kribbella voronezhensis]|uniref:Uncharacterized protein n=1 Tax=Kribbella voronezhensis TaxID=2512212 RepID=A0A4R7T8S7_9ACTN|nr:hypothetical protein [Kribbella voronezhensis]TDU87608.1 hypothetical protein EV138_1132 [Kribbella voronezhensis]
MNFGIAMSTLAGENPLALKLYLLTRTGNVDYDEAAAMVVAACELWPARAIAAASHAAEPDAEWTSPNHSTCDLIGLAAEGITPRVLLIDVKGC